VRPFHARRRIAESPQEGSDGGAHWPFENQWSILEAINRAEDNVNPLYENIDACGKTVKPEGGVDLSAIVLDSTILSDVRTVLSEVGYADKQDFADSVLRVTVKTARKVRAEVEAARSAAVHVAEKREEATLETARDGITCAMKDYAAEIDPRGRVLADFEKAEAVWSQIREDEKILKPLLTGDNHLFSQRWRSLESPERNALRRLEKWAGLDRKALDRWAEAHKPRRGTSGWVGRHPVLTAFAPLAVIFASSVGWKDPMAFVFPVAVFAFIGMFALGAELARTEEKLDDLKTHAEAEDERRVEDIRAQRYYIRKLSKRCQEGQGAPD
jgi:hypothetical protein